MNKVKYRIPPILLLLILCGVGFFTGVFSMALRKGNFLVNDNVLGQEFMYQMADLRIDKRALFFLCFWKRMRAFFLLFLLAFSSVNLFTNAVFFLLNGLYIGSVMELFSMRYGLQGILMYLSFVLPQGVFYAMGFLSLGCWCLRLEWSQHGFADKKIGKIKTGLNKKTVFMAFLLILIGVLLESFINSKIFFLFI